MESSNSSTQAFLGHVRNGVIVPDAPIVLDEGQAVRFEPLATPEQGAECAGQVRQLQNLFATWTEEDGRLTEDEADRLHLALEQNRGVGFRSPTLD